MGEQDVELGLLNARPAETRLSTETLSSHGALHILRPQRIQSQAIPKDDGFEDSDDGSTAAEKGVHVAQDAQAILQDEDCIKLPRRKVEQLMGMWINVLQQSLQAEEQPRKHRSAPIGLSYNSSQHHVPSTSNSRYPPISYSSDAHPWATIKPMAQFELEAENGWRRLGRSMWKTPENLAHLEDSWKYLWEPMVGVDRGLFQWNVVEKTRKMLQYDLVDALCANERIVSAMSMRRDYRAISTFITLIGLRLNEQYRSYHRYPEMGPVKQTMILIECIWACNAFDPSNDIKEGYREGPRLSNVLTACYRRHILNRPEEGFDDYITTAVLIKHCQAVRRSLHLINLLHKHQISAYMHCENLNQARELWSMPLPDVEAPSIHVPYRSSTLRDGADAFLRIDDFNLRDLQILGHLQIQWTSYWDEHLQLETSSTANILKIYWFQPKLAQYLVEKYITPYPSLTPWCPYQLTKTPQQPPLLPTLLHRTHPPRRRALQNLVPPLHLQNPPPPIPRPLQIPPRPPLAFPPRPHQTQHLDPRPNNQQRTQFRPLALQIHLPFFLFLPLTKQPILPRNAQPPPPPMVQGRQAPPRTHLLQPVPYLRGPSPRTAHLHG